MRAEHSENENPTPEFRWWYLPSWLGLDAPCVVLTWTWATSRATNLPLLVRPALALFLVVWCIYLSDRLVDVARCADWTKATGRLRFGRRWRPLFWACLGCSILATIALLWAGLPAEVMWRASLVAFGVGLHYLAFIMPLFSREKLPGKEFGVGLFFALGAYACLGADVRAVPLLCAVAVVVAFNCLVIASRDAESDLAIDPQAASGWWMTMNRDLRWLGLTLTIVAASLAALVSETPFYLSVTLSLAALTALHLGAHRLSGDSVRAIADFVLFTPLAVMSIHLTPT